MLVVMSYGIGRFSLLFRFFVGVNSVYFIWDVVFMYFFIFDIYLEKLNS